MVFSNPSEAYLSVIEQVIRYPDFIVSPRKLPIREKVNVTFSITRPSSKSIITKDEIRNVVIADYVAKEFDLYESKTNNVKDFAEASKFWLKIANPNGTVNSAYGHLIWGEKSVGNYFFSLENPITPWEWALESLRRDKDTRQAFLRFSHPSHQWHGNRDQVCTMHGNFLIRANRLHFTIVMRSCDCVKGLVYDMPWFCYLLERMHQDLQRDYSGLRIGSYTHFAHSLHVYESRCRRRQEDDRRDMIEVLPTSVGIELEFAAPVRSSREIVDRVFTQHGEVEAAEAQQRENGNFMTESMKRPVHAVGAMAQVSRDSQDATQRAMAATLQHFVATSGYSTGASPTVEPRPVPFASQRITATQTPQSPPNLQLLETLASKMQSVRLSRHQPRCVAAFSAFH
jgi:thymidylate synthase